MSVSSQMPFDLLRLIFGYTDNLILRGQTFIQIRKLTESKYTPLRELFSSANEKRIITKTEIIPFIKVDLLTEDGRHFYTLHSYGRRFTAYSVIPLYSSLLYERE